jgi:deoxyribonuclease V
MREWRQSPRTSSGSREAARTFFVQPPSGVSRLLTARFHGGALGRVETRYAAVDVYYPASGGAVAALVLADDARFGSLVEERTARLTDVAPYQPGAFFTRELPALRAVLDGAGPLALLIVDGYVHLDPTGRPGLGAHAHEEFGVPVVGVAKTAFHTASHAIEVRRGEATRPLYVTAIGLAVDDAVTLVREMAGQYRLPDALRRVDALSKGR